jgi:ATP-dependent Clp protease adaptor protein ClpS
MKTETLELLETKEEIVTESALVLYNDDVNTFDHVINSLMATCKHKLMEAEQCAYIVHTAGKCIVKYGMYDELEPQCTSLLEKGLSAKIE